DHKIHISRVNSKTTYETKFSFVAAQNPCPCGNLFSKNLSCVCIFSACSTHQEQNVFYQQNLFSQTCNKQFFQEQQEKNSQNKDVI
ncbi:ATP-binding protein, partial [Campylobacter coli]